MSDSRIECSPFSEPMDVVRSGISFFGPPSPGGVGFGWFGIPAEYVAHAMKAGVRFSQSPEVAGHFRWCRASGMAFGKLVVGDGQHMTDAHLLLDSFGLTDPEWSSEVYPNEPLQRIPVRSDPWTFDQFEEHMSHLPLYDCSGVLDLPRDVSDRARNFSPSLRRRLVKSCYRTMPLVPTEGRVYSFQALVSAMLEDEIGLGVNDLPDSADWCDLWEAGEIVTPADVAYAAASVLIEADHYTYEGIESVAPVLGLYL